MKKALIIGIITGGMTAGGILFIYREKKLNERRRELNVRYHRLQQRRKEFCKKSES
ncbi:MAG: hypothetical protein U0K57_07395 [Lachnospiraceae bacterium]|nr:hypothetical protein [Lachnospiraceae bacterium]